LKSYFDVFPVLRARPTGAVTLAAAGDIACQPPGSATASSCRQNDTARLIAYLNPTVIAALGDNQYEAGAIAAYAGSFDNAWGMFKDRIRPAVGNHEYKTRDAAGYFGYFGRRAGAAGRGWYAYRLGTWRIIVLNSNCDEVGGCGPGSDQHRWLLAELASNRRLCTLAYWHHPRFSSGPHGDHDDVVPFWDALYDARADVVLSGHDHTYERFAPMAPDGRLDASRGIRQFVVGTGGKSHYPIRRPRPNSVVHDDETYGVLRLTLRSGRYDFRFVPVAGESFADSGTGRCR
jgi:hypothetical protein